MFAIFNGCISARDLSKSPASILGHGAKMQVSLLESPLHSQNQGTDWGELLISTRKGGNARPFVLKPPQKTKDNATPGIICRESSAASGLVDPALNASYFMIISKHFKCAKRALWAILTIATEINAVIVLSQIRSGVVSEFLLWEHRQNLLKLSPRQQPHLLTQPPQSLKMPVLQQLIPADHYLHFCVISLTQGP